MFFIPPSLVGGGGGGGWRGQQATEAAVRPLQLCEPAPSILYSLWKPSRPASLQPSPEPDLVAPVCPSVTPVKTEEQALFTPSIPPSWILLSSAVTMPTQLLCMLSEASLQLSSVNGQESRGGLHLHTFILGKQQQEELQKHPKKRRLFQVFIMLWRLFSLYGCLGTINGDWNY